VTGNAARKSVVVLAKLEVGVAGVLGCIPATWL
jgi:hypothetical protein